MIAAALSAAIAAAVASRHLADGCDAAQVRPAIASADVRRLGTVAGQSVLLVSLQASCMCGNVNCPYLVLRTGKSPAVLLVTYAYAVDVVPSSEPLPRLRERAHDSALVVDEQIDAYRGTSYVTLTSSRVRSDTLARKPNAIPVRFVAGASSARISGSVSLGWNDVYTFDAARGQQLTIGSVRSPERLSLTLFGPANAQPIEVRSGVPVKLIRSGTFMLHVDGGGDQDTPYALTLSIR